MSTESGQPRTAKLFELIEGRSLLVAFAGYVLLSLVLLYPMPFQLGEFSFHLAHPTNGHNEDTLVMSTTLQLKGLDLLGLDFGNYFQHRIFYPYDSAMLFSELLLPQVLFALPLTALGFSPHLTHDVLLWLSYPAAGLGMFALAQLLFRRFDIAFLCGFCFAYCPYQFNHLIHINLRLVALLPLGMLFLLRYLDKRRIRDAALATTLYGLYALSNGYLFLFGNLFAVALIVTGAYQYWGSFTRRDLYCVGACALALGLAIVPLLLPYFEFNQSHLIHQQQSSAMVVAQPQDFLSHFSSSWMWGRSLGIGAHERVLFFGLVPLGLVGWGLFARAGRQAPYSWLRSFSGIAMAAAAILCLGPSLWISEWEIPLPYQLLQAYHPGFHALRVSSRMGLYFVFFASLLVGWGLAALPHYKPGRRAIVGSILLLCIALEYGVAPLEQTQTVVPNPERDRLHSWLAQRPQHLPVFNLPTGTGFDGIQATYMYGTSQHAHPIVGGKSSVQSSLFYELSDLAAPPYNEERSEQLIQALRSVGVHFLIEWDGQSEQAGALQDLAARSPQLRQEARFGDAWVFALTSSRLRRLNELTPASDTAAFRFRFPTAGTREEPLILALERNDRDGLSYFNAAAGREVVGRDSAGDTVFRGIIKLPALIPPAGQWIGGPLYLDAGSTFAASSVHEIELVELGLFATSRAPAVMSRRANRLRPSR